MESSSGALKRRRWETTSSSSREFLTPCRLLGPDGSPTLSSTENSQKVGSKFHKVKSESETSAFLTHEEETRNESQNFCAERLESPHQTWWFPCSSGSSEPFPWYLNFAPFWDKKKKKKKKKKEEERKKEIKKKKNAMNLWISAELGFREWNGTLMLPLSMQARHSWTVWNSSESSVFLVIQQEGGLRVASVIPVWRCPRRPLAQWARTASIWTSGLPLPTSQTEPSWYVSVFRFFSDENPHKADSAVSCHRGSRQIRKRKNVKILQIRPTRAYIWFP